MWLAPLSCSARQDRNKLASRIILTYILISILFNLTISSHLSNRFNGIRNDFRSGVGSAPTDCPADPSHRCLSHAPSLDVGLYGHQRERAERTAPRRRTPCCFAYTISGRLEWRVTLSCTHDKTSPDTRDSGARPVPQNQRGNGQPVLADVHRLAPVDRLGPSFVGEF